MSFLNNVKMVNAWRELYNGLCYDCRRKIVWYVRAGKQKGMTDKEISDKCTGVVCDKCRAWLTTKMAEIMQRFGQ